MTGNEMLTRLGNLVQEYDNDVAAEKARALDHLNAEREKLEAEIAALGEDYLLASATFSTTASRSPNRYALPPLFKEMRMLERVVDETTGSYERIYPIQHIGDHVLGETEWIPGMLTTSSGTGRPDGYLVGTDFIQLEPICDAVYTMRMWYVKRYDDLVASGAETDIPHAVCDVLILGAAIREREYRRDNVDSLLKRYVDARNRGLSNLQVRRQDGPQLIQYIGGQGDYC